jgi:phage/plasmid-associated DNA primase
MDTLGDFLIDKCVAQAGAKVTAKDLYIAYDAWAHQAGEKPITKKTFGNRLAERGFDKKRAEHGPVWLGLRLRSAMDRDSAPAWVTGEPDE